jgi:hypothetical protein
MSFISTLQASRLTPLIRVRAADPVRAGPAEGQRAVLLALDLHQQVEHPVRRIRLHPVGHPGDLVGDLRVVPADPDLDGARLRRRLGGCRSFGSCDQIENQPSSTGCAVELGRRVELGTGIDQYFRAIG